MKISNLRRNIAINLSASAALLVIFFVIILYLINSQNSSEQKTQRIHADTASLKGQMVELQGKISDAKRYRELWKSIDKNKRSDRGIKMDEVNSNMEASAKNYSISNQTLQAALPENLNAQIFNLKTLSISHTSGTLSFNAVDDLKANSFIVDFLANFPAI